MKDIEHLHKQAAECKENAATAKDLDQREGWLRLAEEYEKLASEIEERLARDRDRRFR